MWKVHSIISNSLTSLIVTFWSNKIIYFSFSVNEEPWQFSYQGICKIWGSHTGGYENSIFQDITSFSLMRANESFGGIYRLYLQGRIVSQETNMRQAVCFFLLGLLVDSQDGRDMFLRKVCWYHARWNPSRWLIYMDCYSRVQSSRLVLVNSVLEKPLVPCKSASVNLFTLIKGRLMRLSQFK
jgi:hypothetical protein